MERIHGKIIERKKESERERKREKNVTNILLINLRRSSNIYDNILMYIIQYYQ